MGIDFLDLIFRLELEFDIQLKPDELWTMVKAGRAAENATRLPDDLRISDVVSWVESTVNAQNPAQNFNLFPRVRKQIVVCLHVNAARVTPHASLIHDLGME